MKRHNPIAMSVEKQPVRKIQPVNMRQFDTKGPVIKAGFRQPPSQKYEKKENDEVSVSATPASISHYFFIPLDFAQVAGETIFWTHQLEITSPSEKRAVVVFRTKSFNLTNFPADNFPNVYWVAVDGYVGFRNKTNTSTERIAPYSLKSVSMLVYEGTISYSAEYQLMNDIAWQFPPGAQIRIKVYQDEDPTPLSELPTTIPIQLVVKHLNA